MDGFDFNIHNYSLREMEDLLGLALKNNYTADDVSLYKQRLIVKLGSSGKRDTKMTEFLEAVSHCLINGLGGLSNGADDKPNSDDNTTNSDSGSKKNLPQNYYSPVHNYDKNTIIPGTQNDGHFVIADPYRITKDSSGLTVGQSGAPPGIINPVKYSTIVTTVNIDSRFRPNYFTTKSTDLYVSLPDRIDNVINYRIGSFEIPFYAIYSISELTGNNAIQIAWNTTGHDQPYTPFNIVIPDGNYYTTLDTINVLASASIESTINAIIDSNTGGVGLAGLLYFYIDQISGKSVFAQPKDAASPVYFKITTNIRSTGILNYVSPLMSFMGWQLGFRNATYLSKNSGTGGFGNLGSVVSEALLSLKAASYIFISIDDYNNSVNDYYSAVFSESYVIKNVITRVNVGFLRDVNEPTSTQLNRQRSFFGPVNIQKLRITLYDNYGRIVDLNNMDWNLELIFECVYD